MNHSDKLIKNILSNYAGVLIPAAVFLLLTPFMIKTLGPTAYGIWIIANTLRSYFQIMEFGIRTSVIKFVSEYHAKGEKRKIEELFTTSFFAFLIIGIISLIILKVIADFAPNIFKIPFSYFETLKTLISIFGLNIAVIFLNRIFEGTLAGFQRYDLVNLLNIISETLNAVLTVLLLLLGYGLISLSILSVLLSVSVFFIQTFVLKKYYSLGIKISRFSWQAIINIADFSFFSFAIEVAAKVSAKMDSLIIGIFMPVAAVTEYIIGVKLASITEKLTDPMVDIFFPYASELSINNDKSGLHRLLIEGTKISALISFPLTGFLFLSGEAAINLWIGKGYQSSVAILNLFLLISAVSILEATSSRILLGIGKIRFNALVSIFSALSNLALSLILIKPLGLKGVAIGTLIPLAIVNLFLLIPYACAKINLPIRELISRSLVPPIIPIIPVFSFLFFLNHFLKLNDFHKLLLNTVILFPSYFILFFTFCLSRDEKIFYGNRIKAFLKGERIFSFFSK